METNNKSYNTEFLVNRFGETATKEIVRLIKELSQYDANIVTTNATSLTAEVNNYYRFDNAVETLAITLPAMSDTTIVKTIVFYLTGGTSPNVTFTSTAPSGGTAPAVYTADDFSIESGSTYEINALFNGNAWIVANVKINVE